MSGRWNATDMPNQDGRLAIITGANSGLGYAASLALAKRGCALVLACRSQDKAEQARRKLIQQLPDADVRIELLDVASLHSVHAFAERMRQAGLQPDLLINNAGVMAIPQARSVDGFELQLATNHLGHFALTGLLLPSLAPGGRVVAVSSIAAQRAAIDFSDLMGQTRYRPWKAYGQSKLANLMFVLELQRRLTQSGSSVTAVAAHPGTSSTNLYASAGASLAKRIIAPLLAPVFQSADQGVLPILYAATSAQAEPGGYYGPDGFHELKGWPAPASRPAGARNESDWKHLWEVSESLTGVHFPAATT